MLVQLEKLFLMEARSNTFNEAPLAADVATGGNAMKLYEELYE